MREYDANVFINCPFDRQFLTLFRAIVFTVSDCGFRARCSLELEDAGQNRLQKLLELMSICRIGIHDLSRIELDSKTRLPRFNMPLELGVFLGAKHFGTGLQRRKLCLILDNTPYRYQRFISDIAGQDISAHHGSIPRVIRAGRDFLRNTKRDSVIPSGSKVHERFLAFGAAIPPLCAELHLDSRELNFNDYTFVIYAWLKRNVLIKPKTFVA